MNKNFETSAANRAAIWNFFQENPCHSQLDCGRALDLNKQTVNKHVKAIRAGWRPKVESRVGDDA